MGFGKYLQQRLRTNFQIRRRKLLRVTLRGFGKPKLPRHQRSSVAISAVGVAIPSRSDSRMPGIDNR